MININNESLLLSAALGFSSKGRTDAMSKFALRRAAQCCKLANKEEAIKYAEYAYHIADNAISNLIDLKCIKGMDELRALYRTLDDGMKTVQLAWKIPDESWDKLKRQPLGRKNGRSANN